MPGPSRQVAYDVASLITVVVSIIEFVIIATIVYWFYSTMKKILKTLEDIKELLQDGKTPGNHSEEQYR